MLLSCLIVAATLGTPPAPSTAWKTFKITGATAAKVYVQGNSRTYYSLNPESPLNVTIDGPTRLRIISRIVIPPGAPDTLPYRLSISEEDGPSHVLEARVAVLPVARLENPRRPVAASRRMVVELPAGHHHLTMSLSGVDVGLIRLQQKPYRPVTSMVALAPSNAARTVTVSEAQKRIPYYGLKVGEPVLLRVVGPAKLDLLTRLDFDSTMSGVQPYEFRISERGKTLLDVKLQTTRSSAAVYTDVPDRVPSRFERTRVEVGRGRHEIEVELTHPTSASATVRPLVSPAAVKNKP